MRFTMVAAVIVLLFAPYFALYLKLPYTGLMNILYGISLALTPVILHRTRSLRIAANWTLSCGLAVLLFQSWVLGGVSSLSYPWLSCLPMAATWALRTRWVCFRADRRWVSPREAQRW
jgi:hypothetical protein